MTYCRSYSFLLLFLLTLLAGLAPCFAAQQPAKTQKAADKPADARLDPRARRQAIASVKSWSLQFRYLNIAEARNAPLDMIVIDHAPHPKKGPEQPFASTDIAPLKSKSDGGRRLVLSRRWRCAC